MVVSALSWVLKVKRASLLYWLRPTYLPIRRGWNKTHLMMTVRVFRLGIVCTIMELGMPSPLVVASLFSVGDGRLWGCFCDEKSDGSTRALGPACARRKVWKTARDWKGRQSEEENPRIFVHLTQFTQLRSFLFMASQHCIIINIRITTTTPFPRHSPTAAQTGSFHPPRHDVL